MYVRCRTDRLPSRHDLPKLPIGLVGDDVQRAVAALAHVADALAAVGEQVLLARDAIVLHARRTSRLSRRAPTKRLPFHAGKAAPL